VDPRVQIVVKIIGEQKGEIHLTLRASSRLLGVSEAYLLRLFKREVGTTFRRYLRKERMAQAAELVSDPSLAIKRIALVSGYSDVSNFYRDFKQAHGMSPRELRVRHLRLLSEESLRGATLHVITT
jgi:AraC-like DNA-binding protein